MKTKKRYQKRVRETPPAIYTRCRLVCIVLICEEPDGRRKIPLTQSNIYIHPSPTPFFFVFYPTSQLRLAVGLLLASVKGLSSICIQK